MQHTGARMMSTKLFRDMLHVLILFHMCSVLVKGYELTIVHNNDVHAHFEQMNKYSGECTDADAQKEACYGGEARRVTFIKSARANYSNTLVLDAGDRFTGMTHTAPVERLLV